MVLGDDGQRDPTAFAVVGTVGGARLRISVGDRNRIDEDVATLRDLWKSAFERAIESGEVL